MDLAKSSIAERASSVWLAVGTGERRSGRAMIWYLRSVSMKGTVEPDLRVSLLRLLKSDRMPSSANARSTLKSRVRRPGEYTHCLSRIDSRKPLWRVFTTWVLAPERVTG
jgi:hypothetical protein